MAWNDSTIRYDIDPGEKHHQPMTIVVEPNGGSAKIQFRESGGN